MEVNDLDNAGDDDAQAAFDRPRPPYGHAIHDAINSGDLQRMKAVAEGARKALYEVEFAPVAPEQIAEVTDALRALEDAISRLEPPRRADEPGS
ncbi:DUF1843 domain-containing protein [Nocardia amamiensis]|uniref:DUF1843 domain-containing protein n=1 Tax=Nocardia amamiensis TaxID=404578 RepID=A0ABS0D2E2_9NOCA|nr:DUF1843 domain-containing protein [Nocardia amamiensis]MBF6303010.1 DUF1843 domain-containing protein [Nocardia amamiensis]